MGQKRKAMKTKPVGNKLSAEDRRAQAQKLLASPVRTRILGWLAGKSEPQTQCEIGKALTMSTASVHYHIKMMLPVDLIRLEGTRPGPNGITEKLYSTDPKIMAGDAGMTPRERFMFYLNYTASSVQEMHREGQEWIREDPKQHRFYLGGFVAHATDSEYQSFKNKLQKLVEAFKEKHVARKKNSRPMAITFGVLPTNAQGWTTSGKIFDMMVG